MENNEVSYHAVLIYHALENSRKWMTNKEIAVATKKVSERTVRMYTKRFVQMGLIDQAELHPAHRYRWSDKADKRNQAYLLRLQKAAEIFLEIETSAT